jgi:glycosyltransferase involved in cell wall biosynthesis
VQSVIEQSVKDWELIVVNDGSTDHTDRLMEYFTKLDSRIKYIKLPKNKGIAYARNAGNKAAQGDIILIHDSDDLSAPDRLKITMAHFKKYSDTDFFYGAYLRCDIFGNPVEEVKPEKPDLERMLKKQYIPHFCSAYKKSTVMELPYDNAHHVNDDYPLMVKWLKAGKIFRYTDKPLGKYRQLPCGVSITNSEEVNRISREVSNEYECAR